MNRVLTLFAALLVAAAPAFAQSDGRYDPRALFAPLPMPGAANAYRGGSGKPGPVTQRLRAAFAEAVRMV